MNKNLFCAFLINLMILSGAAAGFAAEEGAAPGGPDAEKMAEWMKLAAPGPEHKALDPFVGEWNYTMSWKMKADAPAETSSGTSEAKWIMDGRFIQAMTKGEAMGKPFEGMAIMGYDNMKKEYSSIWLDNMSTSVMHSTGKYDDAGKSFTEEGKFLCPMTGGKEKDFKGVTRWIDNDHYTYEMTHDDEDGEEFKSLDIKYERQ